MSVYSLSPIRWMKSNYRLAYACLTCRKSFKRGKPAAKEFFPDTMPCPNCGRLALNFGRHFKAPKKNDDAQWKKVRYLAEHGFWFQRIHIGEKAENVVPYPDTLEQARDFVEKYKEHALTIDARIWSLV